MLDSPKPNGEKPKRANLTGKDTARANPSQGLSPILECGKGSDEMRF
ncbi:hypothetical protein [Dactylococcopsis salina]|nr:hypothetical protein [Dactylococcopsis salina]